MKTLFILNGTPYGDQSTYNGLRLSGSLDGLACWTAWAEQILAF